MKAVTYAVEVGESTRDYAVGDFLNAINEICCYFSSQRSIRDDEMKAALAMYVNTMED